MTVTLPSPSAALQSPAPAPRTGLGGHWRAAGGAALAAALVGTLAWALGWLPATAGPAVVVLALAAAGCFARSEQLVRASLNRLDRALAEMSRGQLAALDVGDSGQAQRLARNVSGLVAHVRSTAVIIGDAASHLEQQGNQVKHQAETLAATLQQTRASTRELAEGARGTATHAGQIRSLAAEASELSLQGGAAMLELGQATRATIESVGAMRAALDTINGVAYQTNLLALNAAVEAARAGEAGRGFAVVAAEVRQLANRSATTATEIKELVEAATERSQRTGSTVDATTRHFKQMQAKVEQVGSAAATIDQLAAAQSQMLQEISAAVEQIDEASNRNMATVDVLESQAHGLKARADELSEGTSHYRLHQGTADEAVALVKRVIAHCRQVGLEQGMRDVSAPDSPFRDRDLYVSGHNDRHTLVCLSTASPTRRVGDNETELKDGAGMAVVQGIVATGRAGGGWFDYTFRNPATGELAPKTSYIERHEDVNFLCGVYKPTSL